MNARRGMRKRAAPRVGGIGAKKDISDKAGPDIGPGFGIFRKNIGLDFPCPQV